MKLGLKTNSLIVFCVLGVFSCQAKRETVEAQVQPTKHSENNRSEELSDQAAKNGKVKQDDDSKLQIALDENEAEAEIFINAFKDIGMAAGVGVAADSHSSSDLFLRIENIGDGKIWIPCSKSGEMYSASDFFIFVVRKGSDKVKCLPRSSANANKSELEKCAIGKSDYRDIPIYIDWEKCQVETSSKLSIEVQLNFESMLKYNKQWHDWDGKFPSVRFSYEVPQSH